MDETNLKMNILFDILTKKLKLLKQILSITENQESLITSGSTDDAIIELFRNMSHEKQLLIDELLVSDSLFQNTFNEILDKFEKFAKKNPEKIIEMKKLITLVTDFDVKVRVAERRNKELTSVNKFKKLNIPKANKNYILNQYKNNNQKPKL